MLNQCAFIGRLTRKPELRKPSADKSVTSFTLAVDRERPDASGKWPSDFVDCVAWNKKAEKIAEKYDKGDMLCVTGRWQNRTVKGKDGQSRQVIEIIVENCYRVKAAGQPGQKSVADPGVSADEQEAPSEEDYGLLDGEDPKLPF